jgi:small subunit ribosomal protein S3
MGQKVNPVAFRTGKYKTWKSRWFADNKSYKDKLLEDIKIRDFLMKRLVVAGIESVEIERLTKSIVIKLTVSRPGVVIGRGGSGIEDLRKQIEEIVKKHRKSAKLSDVKIDLQVVEVKNPEVSAQLVASRIVSDLERRMPHRRTVMRTMERVIQSGAKGVKIVLSGRIAGADISRVEKYHQGSVPTQTLRANVDYAQVPALLKRGYVGVKVWIYKENED